MDSGPPPDAAPWTSGPTDSPPQSEPVPDRPAPTEPSRLVRPSVIAPPPARPRTAADLPRARRVEPPEVRPVSRPSDYPRRRLAARRITPVLPLLIALFAFGGMMAVSFGQGLYALFSHSDLPTLSETQIKNRLVNETLVFEGLDTVIVVLGVLIAGRPLARAVGSYRLATWMLAVPGFIVLLGINLGYHQTLRWIFTSSHGAEVQEYIDIGLKDGAWAILLICVQPAVVEELFFRYLLFGHLRPHIGTHGAVWLSAVIFGMAHLGNIPGWPVLMLLGAGLGYARAYSGGLALPIALHFLHNFAVLVIDYIAKSH